MKYRGLIAIALIVIGLIGLIALIALTANGINGGPVKTYQITYIGGMTELVHYRYCDYTPVSDGSLQVSCTSRWPRWDYSVGGVKQNGLEEVK